MTSKPIISIIIPIYNCEKLVPFTLNSILGQSFIDWECILIDDNSTDNVLEILYKFQKLDKRFIVFKKPIELKQGANVSRNFGFSKAKGEYIKWFDCDDIMLPNHLELIYNTLIEKNLDFVVSDTVNFDNESNKIIGKPYEFDRSKAVITPENLALNKIGWITDDFFGKKEVLNEIKFNEEISFIGDEYNFFVRFLHININGIIIEKVLTQRRIHPNSITNSKMENINEHLVRIAFVKYLTANDLIVYGNINLIRWFLMGYMQCAFELATKNVKVPYKIPAFNIIKKYFSRRKANAFLLSIFLANYFKKGYKIMKYARS
ncbi:MAG: glycosyltransferase family 2 protein [Flavobacteriaceae bacterium]|nr:glycosyltransferase family 2 protein [Flavobacteriaceae bacterium]